MLNGIDIASHQGGIDVSKVEADFVIVKVSGGTSYVNDKAHGAEQNWWDIAKKVLKSGKLLGLYHYACEYGLAPGGKAEAEFFLSQIKDFIGKAVLCLDFEADAQDQPVSYAKAWLDTVRKATGATPMFYAYASYLNSRDHSAIRMYPLWMASYLYRYMWGKGYVSDPANTWDTSSWNDMTMYQYSSTRTIKGFSGRLDVNVFYGTRQDWKALCGEGKAQPEARIKRGEVAAAIHADMCNDEDNGYSWEPRWGEDGKGLKTLTIGGRKYQYDRGSYECGTSYTAAWRSALAGTEWEHALDGYVYSGNAIETFVGSGLFVKKPMSFLAEPGDMYLNVQNHVAMCQTQVPDVLSEFSWGDNGAYGNEVGDQTGMESSVHAYYDYPWDCILHYNGKADSSEGGQLDPHKIKVDGIWGAETTMELRRQLGLRVNDKRNAVLYRRLQKRLKVNIRKAANVGKFNLKTRRALQKKLGVAATGVIDKKTVRKLQRALNKGLVAKW